jgi:hypothetical protein
MQAIRPEHLTDEEVLRQVYLMGNEMLPKAWVEEMCKRMARLIDENNAFGEAEYRDEVYNADYNRGYDDGVDEGKSQVDEEKYNEGFAAGVAAANQ